MASCTLHWQNVWFPKWACLFFFRVPFLDCFNGKPKEENQCFWMGPAESAGSFLRLLGLRYPLIGPALKGSIGKPRACHSRCISETKPSGAMPGEIAKVDLNKPMEAPGMLCIAGLCSRMQGPGPGFLTWGQFLEKRCCFFPSKGLWPCIVVRGIRQTGKPEVLGQAARFHPPGLALTSIWHFFACVLRFPDLKPTSAVALGLSMNPPVMIKWRFHTKSLTVRLFTPRNVPQLHHPSIGYDRFWQKRCSKATSLLV